MTHDPLCPVTRELSGDDDSCMCCSLIAKVRADQDRRNAAADLTRLGQEMGMIP